MKKTPKRVLMGDLFSKCILSAESETKTPSVYILFINVYCESLQGFTVIKYKIYFCKTSS